MVWGEEDITAILTPKGAPPLELQAILELFQHRAVHTWNGGEIGNASNGRKASAIRVMPDSTASKTGFRIAPYVSHRVAQHPEAEKKTGHSG